MATNPVSLALVAGPLLDDLMAAIEDTMTDSTYPDLASVEDWLNAKGFTGEAGACHAAMSLIRKQEARIAELEAELKFEADHWLTLRTVYSARIAELEAALNEILNYIGGANNALEDEYVMERARAALEKKK